MWHHSPGPGTLTNCAVAQFFWNCLKEHGFGDIYTYPLKKTLNVSKNYLDPGLYLKKSYLQQATINFFVNQILFKI